MRNYRLNLGLSFHRPYESQYATMRRFICANSATPWSVLCQQVAVKMGMETLSAKDVLVAVVKLNAQAGASPVANLLPDTPHKYCPQCAVHLYHSPIFDLPWLNTCPIHQVPLVSRCHCCKRVLPRADRVGRRDCECCGKSTLHRRAGPLKASFKDIRSLYQLALSMPPETEALSTEIDNAENWPNVTVAHSDFPSYRMAEYPTPTLERWLVKLQIPVRRVQQVGSQLSPVDRATPELVYWLDNAQERLRDRFRVFEQILRRHPHGYKLADYRDFPLGWSSNKPPCPRCLALSLWFTTVVSYPYNSRVHISVGDHWFIAQLGNPAFMVPAPQRYLQSPQGLYEVDEAFQSWSYQQSLLDFYQNMRLLGRAVSVFFRRKSAGFAEAQAYYERFLSKCAKSSRTTLYWSNNNRLMVLYAESTDATSDKSTERSSAIGAKCRGFHRQAIDSVPGFHPRDLEGGPFDFDTYREIESRFRERLLGEDYHRFEARIVAEANEYHRRLANVASKDHRHGGSVGYV